MPVGTQNHTPCEVPKIVTEDVDMDSVDEVFASPPPRARMRSLSGGAYRLTPVPAAGRMRRQSGDDVLSGISPSRRAAIFDAFRPRSKSDTKGKRPTFLTTLKNSVQQTFMAAAFPSSTTNSAPKQLEPDLLDPLVHGDNRHRPRSGSETKSGPMSKMIDMFRNRSNSLSIDFRNKRPLIGPPSITASALLRRYSVDPDKRKASTNYHRSLDGYLEEQNAHYSSDSEDLKDHNIEESKSILTFEDIENENMILPRFFDYHQCYSLIPLSAKLVVLDTQLPVKKAFFSLLKNNIRAAPLWENRTFQFIGMLTITDFINILRTYYNAADENMEQLEDQRIEAWRNILKMNERPFISIDPDKSLTEAIKTLVYQKVHRLPVVQPGTTNVLYVITHKRILKFLSLHFSEIPLPSFLEKTIKELKIGTYENIATATPETTVIEALNLFVERGVSALPVVENGQVVNIYAKFDVFALAEKNTYGDLDISIRMALEHRSESFEGVHTCTLDNTLKSVIQRIIEAEVHRIVVVDKGNKVIGMISLSDILKFLVLRPLGLEQIQLKQLQPDQNVPEEKEQTSTTSSEHIVIQESTLPESRKENLQLSESED